MPPIVQSLPTLDLREVEPFDRHPLIFSTFLALPVGETMELVNDHDPRPLQFQFQAQLPGKFTWEALESGPEVWRVRIGRLAGGHGNGQCCGSCGGA